MAIVRREQSRGGNHAEDTCSRDSDDRLADIDRERRLLHRPGEGDEEM
jgi:hypothetical protein